MRYEHGDVWGAGMCPYQGKTPGKQRTNHKKSLTFSGSPLYQWTCINGVVFFDEVCIWKNTPSDGSCINDAPNGLQYDIGTDFKILKYQVFFQNQALNFECSFEKSKKGECELANVPLASWHCENGHLKYSNPCYEHY